MSMLTAVGITPAPHRVPATGQLSRSRRCVGSRSAIHPDANHPPEGERRPKFTMAAAVALLLRTLRPPRPQSLVAHNIHNVVMPLPPNPGNGALPGFRTTPKPTDS